MHRLSRAHDQLRPSYDAVVVGSGYGGGVAAARLARAGLAVAVIERGREFSAGEFPSRFPDLRSAMQVRGKRLQKGPATALYDVRLGEDMHVLTGCGLGGGSLINAGVALRPDPRVFEDPVWPREVSQDGLLDEGFARAQQWLRPAQHAKAALLSKYKALEKAATSLGIEPVSPPVTINFEARVNRAGVEQPACVLCGDCCAGCNVGAKTTVAATYLVEAARHGAAIFTELRADHLEQGRDGSWQLSVCASGDTRAAAPRVLSARIVVLAAGALGSTEILLRSRERGLGISERLGMRFSANGDIIAFGYGSKVPVNAIGVGHPAKVDGLEVGAVVSGQLDIRDAARLENELHVQEGVLPSALAPILPVMFIPNGRLLGAVQSLINGVYRGPFAGLQTFFAVSHDSAGGRIVLAGDHVELQWPGVQEEAVYKRLDEVLARLVTANGGAYVKNPLAGTVMGHQPATAHPLGGCGMGRERSNGVVDHKGRVFDGRPGSGPTAVHDGLYVLDGSIMARSLGVNPLLTITALAERALLHMGRDRGFATTD